MEVIKLKVLIIDDDPKNAEDFAAVLVARANYGVEIASNGFDAGVVAQRFAPHVVLINLLSSGIDAEQICKNIRMSSDLAKTKVIAFAENFNDSEMAALVRKGFDGVLVKNGDIGQVIKVIEDTRVLV